MKRPAVFFDRDNTLIVNDGYLGDPAGVVLVPGAADAIARARAMGYVVVTFSNQSGVARGMFDEEAVKAVDRRMDEMLRAENPQAIVDRHEFCPFHPEAKVERYRQESPLRKPAPGMILKAVISLDLDVLRSWVVGDANRDIEAGRAAGCRTILFNDPRLKKSPAAEGAARADFVVSTLAEAMDVIERERSTRKPSPPVVAPPPSPLLTVAPPATSPAPVTEVPPRDEGPTPASPATSSRLETVATQILQELKRRNEREHADFSVPKLLAGIVQVIVLAVLFVAYLGHQNGQMVQTMLLLAIVLQAMVASLLLMSAHR